MRNRSGTFLRLRRGSESRDDGVPWTRQRDNDYVARRHGDAAHQRRTWVWQTPGGIVVVIISIAEAPDAFHL